MMHLVKVFSVITLALTGPVSAIPAPDPQKATIESPIITLPGPKPTLTFIPWTTTTTCPAITVTQSVTVSVTVSVTRSVTRTVTTCPGVTMTCPRNCTSTIVYANAVLCSVPPQGCTNTVTPTVTLHYPVSQLCPTVTTVTSFKSCHPTPGCPEPVPVTVQCPYI